MAEGSNKRLGRPQGLDEIEASISAIENAVLNSHSAEPRPAIRELGCFIVAQALGVGTPWSNKPASRASSLAEREARSNSAGMRDDYGDAWRGKTRSKPAGGRAYAARADLKPLRNLAAVLARHAARVTRRGSNQPNMRAQEGRAWRPRCYFSALPTPTRPASVRAPKRIAPNIAPTVVAPAPIAPPPVVARPTVGLREIVPPFTLTGDELALLLRGRVLRHRRWRSFEFLGRLLDALRCRDRNCRKRHRGSRT